MMAKSSHSDALSKAEVTVKACELKCGANVSESVGHSCSKLQRGTNANGNVVLRPRVPSSALATAPDGRPRQSSTTQLSKSQSVLARALNIEEETDSDSTNTTDSGPRDDARAPAYGTRAAVATTKTEPEQNTNVETRKYSPEKKLEQHSQLTMYFTPKDAKRFTTQLGLSLGCQFIRTKIRGEEGSKGHTEYFVCNHSGKPRRRLPTARSPDRNRTIKIGCLGKLRIQCVNSKKSVVTLTNEHNHNCSHSGISPGSNLEDLSMTLFAPQISNLSIRLQPVRTLSLLPKTKTPYTVTRSYQPGPQIEK